MDGFVVCEEHKDILIAAWDDDQEIQKQRDREVTLENTHYVFILFFIFFILIMYCLGEVDCMWRALLLITWNGCGCTFVGTCWSHFLNKSLCCKIRHFKIVSNIVGVRG